MDDSGPSRPRRSSDPLLSAHDRTLHLLSSSHDDIPPPQYSEAPRAIFDDMVDDGTREALLEDPGGDGESESRRKRSGDGLEVGREEVRTDSMEKRKALWWRNAIINALFISSWYGFATLLSLYNKWMFSPQYYNFPYPLFVTFCHMLVQFCCAGMIRLIWPKYFKPPERPTRQAYVSKIMPTAVSTGGDIGLSNLSLKTITLSLYTMCKSSTLIFVLFFAFLFHLEKFSIRLVSVISLISFGVFLMVFNTTSVSVPGIIMVFSASGLAGLRWALTEHVMHKKSMGLSNPFATIFWLAPLMAVTLAVVSISLEGWRAVLRNEHFAGPRAVMTIGVIVFPGGLAFAMVTSEYFIIQRAGSVPMSIAGIFKEVSTISISAWVFGDQLTELNIVGVVITVCGIALYTFHKYQKNVSSTEASDQQYGQSMTSQNNEPLDTGEPRFYAMANTESEPLRSPCSLHDEVPLASLDSSATLDRQRRAFARHPGETAEDRIIRLRDEFEGWNGEGTGSEEDDEDREDREEDESERRRNERIGRDDGGKSWGEWWEKEM